MSLHRRIQEGRGAGTLNPVDLGSVVEENLRHCQPVLPGGNGERWDEIPAACGIHVGPEGEQLNRSLVDSVKGSDVQGGEALGLDRRMRPVVSAPGIDRKADGDK